MELLLEFVLISKTSLIPAKNDLIIVVKIILMSVLMYFSVLLSSWENYIQTENIANTDKIEGQLIYV